MAKTRRNSSMSIEMKFLRRRRVTIHFNCSFRCSAIGAWAWWLIPVRKNKTTKMIIRNILHFCEGMACIFGGTDRRECVRCTNTGEHTKTRTVLLCTPPHSHTIKSEKLTSSFLFSHQCRSCVRGVCEHCWYPCMHKWMNVSLCQCVAAFDWIRSDNYLSVQSKYGSEFLFLLFAQCSSHKVLGHESNLRMFACVSCGASIRANIENFDTYLFYDVQKCDGTIERCAGSVAGKVSWELWMDWMSVLAICIVRNAASTAVYICVMQCCVRVAELITCTVLSSIVRMLGIGLKLLCKRLLGLLRNAGNVYVLRGAIAMPNSMLSTKKMWCGCVREILSTGTVWKEKKNSTNAASNIFLPNDKSECHWASAAVISVLHHSLPVPRADSAGIRHIYIQYPWLWYDIRECSTCIEQCARLKLMMLEHKRKRDVAFLICSFAFNVCSIFDIFFSDWVRLIWETFDERKTILHILNAMKPRNMTRQLATNRTIWSLWLSIRDTN